MPRDDRARTGDGTAAAAIAWFASQGRHLPWREPGTSAWGVLVSEVMLQQTPVARVEPVWLDWMRRWPTPAELAAEPQSQAIRAWGRLGYPRRAQRLWESAGVIVDQWNGDVPRDEASLRSLPGVGEYTAAAVAAFAFGDRTLVLDTNVRRVVARLVGGVAAPSPHVTRSERESRLGTRATGTGAGGGVEHRGHGTRRARLHVPRPPVRRVPARGGLSVVRRWQARVCGSPTVAGVGGERPSGARANPRHPAGRRLADDNRRPRRARGHRAWATRPVP